MADEQEAVAKKQMAADKQAHDKVLQQHKEMEKWRPTPTQDENDMAKMGIHVLNKADDGSGPDQNAHTRFAESRHLEGGRGSDYETRQTSARRPASTAS